MNFNIEISKMLEIIDKSDKARKFAYGVLFTLIICIALWKAPEILSVVLK